MTKDADKQLAKQRRSASVVEDLSQPSCDEVCLGITLGVAAIEVGSIESEDRPTFAKDCHIVLTLDGKDAFLKAPL